MELAPKRQLRGCAITRETVATLQSYGVKAMIAVRLDDPLHPDGPPLGTISYFFKRPNTFSWRDVTLFLGFCKRAADVIALARETAIMLQQNRMLEIQSDMAMRAEVASLLVHDLFHKVFHVHERGKDFMDASRKQFRNLRAHVPAEIVAAEEEFEIAVKDLEREVQDLRSVGRLDESDKRAAPVKFKLAVMVDRLLRTMKAPMASQKIDARVDIAPDVAIVGQEKRLERILLTFVLNTIDAAKSRGSSRPMAMYLSATVEGDWVVLKIWDTGPGINVAALAQIQQTQKVKASDVFTIGLSTKNGTGLGLPLARNQLTRFFSGQMKLEDPTKALFELRIKRIND